MVYSDLRGQHINTMLRFKNLKEGYITVLCRLFSPLQGFIFLKWTERATKVAEQKDIGRRPIPFRVLTEQMTHFSAL